MKVSIIVPVYNTEKYLSKCLDSLVKQTLDDIEIILVNDGSTDHSQEILYEYKEKNPEKIRIISKINEGQGAARNVGIKAAIGEYIGFVDSDDYVALDMFEKLYKAAKEAEADLVTCNYYYVMNGKEKKIDLYKPQKQIDLFFNSWVVPWNKLYKRSLLIENQIFYPKIRAYEDTAFYIDSIPFINKIVNIEEALIYQVYRCSSTMNIKQNERVLLIFNIIDYIINFYKIKGIYEKYYIYLEYFCAKILLSSSILRICQIRNKNIRKEYLMRTIDELKTQFPNYRSNKYFKSGIKGLYIQSISKFTLPIYADVIYIIRYMGRNRL